MFKAGDFEKATEHWDKNNRDEFLAERQSKRYLDYWLGMLYKFSRIDIEDYIDKLGSIGKKKDV